MSCRPTKTTFPGFNCTVPSADKLQRGQNEANNEVAGDHSGNVGSDMVQMYQWDCVIIKIKCVVQRRLQRRLSKEMQHLVDPVGILA